MRHPTDKPINGFLRRFTPQRGESPRGESPFAVPGFTHRFSDFSSRSVDKPITFTPDWRIQNGKDAPAQGVSLHQAGQSSFGVKPTTTQEKPSSPKKKTASKKGIMGRHPKHWPKIWNAKLGKTLKKNKLEQPEQETFLEQFNAYRKAYGLKPVKLNNSLNKAADKHSQYQTRLNSCDHYGKGKDWWYTNRAKRAGYEGKPVQENVAAGQRSIEEIIWAWHQSPGHRKAMLDPNITEIGIGFRRGNKGPYGGERWTLLTGRD